VDNQKYVELNLACTYVQQISCNKGLCYINFKNECGF